MAVAISKAGRPHAVARIDYEHDGELQLVDNFYLVCSEFHYREVAALSRALGVCPRTVENWKYKISFPGWYIALQVINWVKNGKPIDFKPPYETAGNML